MAITMVALAFVGGCKKSKKDAPKTETPKTETVQPTPPPPKAEVESPAVERRIADRGTKHAALAVDEKTGGWGYAYDQPTETSARVKSREKCPQCTVRLTWRQGCGALAQADRQKTVSATGHGSTRALAEASAKAACAAKLSGACSIAVWACNSAN